MPGSEQTQGVLKLTQYLTGDSIALFEDYNEDMRKIAQYAQAQIQKEGAANGYATLDCDGKLVQMPTASDVGARPLTWLPSTVDIGAQAQTAARSTVVKADASGALVAAEFNDFAPGIQYEEKNLNENEKAAIWKFPDGTMITSKRRYFNSIVIDKEAGGGAVSTASYELGGIGATFTTYPYVTLTVIASDTAMQGIWIYTAVPSADMMSAYPIIRFAGPYMYKTQGWVHIQAIGRWK